MSRTYAVAADGPFDTPESVPVPLLMIFPGRYIAELWPSTTTGSIVVQVWVATSSARVTTAASFAPASRTRPSGSR